MAGQQRVKWTRNKVVLVTIKADLAYQGSTRWSPSLSMSGMFVLRSGRLAVNEVNGFNHTLNQHGIARNPRDHIGQRAIQLEVRMITRGPSQSGRLSLIGFS